MRFMRHRYLILIKTKKKIFYTYTIYIDRSKQVLYYSLI